MIKKINSNKIKLPPSDPHSQMLNNIGESLEHALHSWKMKLPFSKRRCFKKLPWLLIMGAPNAGKTALLSCAKLPLHSDQASKITPGKPTQQLHCRSHQETFLLDIPGSWYAAGPDSTDEQCLHHLLKLTHAYRKTSAPTHTLIVLDCERLTSQVPHEIQKEQARITNQLQFMYDWNQNGKLTIVLNKADKIPGFIEFFSHLQQADCEKLCGVGLNIDPSLPVIDSLSLQLGAFSKRIHQQTIHKLHHERNENTRDVIMAFPRQIECLVNSLVQLLETTPVRVLSNLQGIYMTSCEQDTDSLSDIEDTIRTGISKKSTDFFINELFASLLTPAKPKIVQRKSFLQGLHIQLALAIILLAGATTALHLGFINSKALLSKVNETVNAESTTTSAQLPKWLNDMNQLEAVNEILTDHSSFTAKELGQITMSQLRQQITKHHNTLEKKLFKKWIFDTVSMQLKQGIIHQSPQLFSDLSTYLQLTNATLVPKEILPWFTRHWSHEFPNRPKLVNLLTRNLKKLLANKDTHWHPNSELIQDAKNSLKKSPPAKIVFMLLLTEYSQEAEAVDINQSSLLTAPLLSINPLYSPSRFKQVLAETIPKLAKKLTDDHTVLGETILSATHPQQIKNLIKSAQQLYINGFSNHWLKSLEQLNIAQSDNLEKDHQLLEYLSKPNSTLIKRMLSVSELMSAQETLPLSQKRQWASINNTLLIPKNKRLLLAAFQESALYIQKILYDLSPERSDFLATQARMKNNPESNPLAILHALSSISEKPFSTWLSAASHSTWKHMLKLSGSYINTQWNTGIYAQYRNTIENRYPVFQQAEENISTSDFNHFFGIGGAIQRFYSSYLDGFIDTKKPYWTFRKLNGEALPIKRGALDAMIRGSLIQKMFYQNSKDAPLIGFQLLPQKLSPNAQQFILNISGQMYTTIKGDFQNFQGTWPGPDSNFVTMHFVTRSGTTPALTRSGPWAWLKILEEAQLTETKDPKTFKLTFGMGKNKATFKLVADSKINPYLPDLLNGLRLPALISKSNDTPLHLNNKD